MRTGIFFVGLLVLAGCSSTPVSTAEATAVPKDRQQLYHQAAPGTAPVIVTRDTGFMGSGCSINILVNGKRAAAIRGGEKLTLHVPAGEVVFGAEPGACMGRLQEVSTSVAVGQPTYLRVSSDYNGFGFQKTIAR